MEHRLRLVKGLSYSGAVYATRKDPYVAVWDGERYRAAMASGYFEEVSVLGNMNITEDGDKTAASMGSAALPAPTETPMQADIAGTIEDMGVLLDGLGQEEPSILQAIMDETAQAEVSMQQGIGQADGGKEGMATGNPIGRMTLEELKAYANVGGIDISGLRKKDDILAAVKAAESKAAEAREALRMG